MDSNTKLQIGHRVNNLIEDLFAAKGIIVHVREKIDCPTYGDVPQEGVDLVAVEYANICRDEINSIIQSAIDKARYEQEESTRSKIRSALGFKDMYK